MNLYGMELTQAELRQARMHMTNKTNRSGAFTKGTLERYVQEHLNIPARMQSRNRLGQFAHIVSPADRMADRMIQRYRKAGRLTAVARVGNQTLWAWK